MIKASEKSKDKLRRESDYHRNAYARMCHKRNDDRKELFTKIKRADLITVYLSIRHMEGMAGKYVAYRNGLMDAFRIVYGDDEAGRLWERLDKRRERITRLINHMYRVKMRGEKK